jgi:nitrogenase molybdenum-cofactor synthesis protein NifE
MTHHSCSSQSKSCAKGRGQTGCAFRGAKMALQPITDAAHLVHGPASCETGSWEFRPTRSSGPDLHRLSLTSDMGEMDVVFGGEKKLLAAIGETIAATDPPAVFVYQTCLPAMTGDDLRAVCQEAVRRWGRPVIPVDAPGLAGSRPYGNHLAAQALLDHVVGSLEPESTTATDINLIGEFNLGGELGRIRPLLSVLGIRVLASLSGDGRYGDIACAHRAKASLLLCSQGMSHLAEGLERRYGIPMLQGSFHGGTNCADTLRRLSDRLVRLGGPIDLPERTERLIRREQIRVERRLQGLRQRLAGKRVMLRCGGAKAWSLIETLQSAGMLVVGSTLNKATQDDRDMTAQLLGFSTNDPDNIEADIVLSGGGNQFEAMKQGKAWLEVNHQRDFALSGFDGGIILLERIARTLESPVWAQLAFPAPWDFSAQIIPFPQSKEFR